MLMHHRLILLATVAVLTACSKEKDIEPPAELVDIATSLDVRRAWNASTGGQKEAMRLGLGAAIDAERVYGAGHNGDVIAVELASGRSIWRVRTKLPLAGGAGAGGGLVVAGSSDGDVVALDAANGAERWRVRIAGEVLSAPAVSAAAVIVRTVDGRLRSLAVDDGRELWVNEQAVPRLSLRGAAAPAIAGDAVVCGFDNGKIVAFALASGDVLWETAVAPARGRTELERLNDIDSAVRVDGDDVFVVGFQGRAARLSLESGQLWWSREVSSHRGLAIDAESVYVATSDGEVVAMQRRSGVESWRQNALLRRGLSAPAVVDGAVAVADFEGYVHWLDAATGELRARTKAGGRVSTAPQSAANTLVVVDDSGRISAFRVPSAASDG
jgi:outer membrane protein assembly factor BamB